MSCLPSPTMAISGRLSPAATALRHHHIITAIAKKRNKNCAYFTNDMRTSKLKPYNAFNIKIIRCISPFPPLSEILLFKNLKSNFKFFIILGSFASLSLEIMVSIGENELGESSRIIQLLGEEGGQLANMKMQLQ